MSGGGTIKCRKKLVQETVDVTTNVGNEHLSGSMWMGGSLKRHSAPLFSLKRLSGSFVSLKRLSAPLVSMKRFSATFVPLKRFL